MTPLSTSLLHETWKGRPPRERLRLRPWSAALLLLCLPPGSARAQELEPRLYANAPVGLNAVVVGYSYSAGNLLLDPSLPIEDADGHLNVVVLAYLRTLGLFGKSAKVDVVLPVSWGRYEGLLEGEFRTRNLSGIGDPRVRLSVNLTGSPALKAPAFGTYQQHTILGASLQIIAPLGTYQHDRLFNLGSNRWTFRPELALSHRRGRWHFELAADVWLFTRNSDFLEGGTLEQQPLAAIRGDVVRAFKPGLWLAVGGGYASGGRTTVNGELRNTFQKNYRYGLTGSVPLGRGHALKLVAMSGATTRVGSDFDTFGAFYQYTWGGR